jgi:predicted amidohydrolase YtcJ
MRAMPAPVPVRLPLVRYAVVVACTAAALGSTRLLSQQAAADFAIVNARVVTLDPRSRIVEAAAITNGVFAAVGTSDEIRRLIGDKTRVIDAHGRTVIPGLIDTHVHALGVASAEAQQPFQDLRSMREIQDWIRGEVGRVAAGAWIWTPRVFPTRVREHRFPTRAELDAVAPRNPVVVDGAYGLMVNTAALRTAGIDKTTPDPPGGAIVKDESGAPTGLLRNVGPLLSRFRSDSDGIPLDMLERVHRVYNEVGITSVIERGAHLDGYQAYRALYDQSRLHVRATVTLRVSSDGSVADTERFIRSLPVTFGEGDDRLKVGPLKVVADGGILAGTAFMREPYGPRAAALYGVADPGYRGFLTLSPDKLQNIIRTGHRLGWQMCSHVTGDAGVDAVLDAVEAANRDSPITDRRYTLIHAYFPNADTADRARRLGVLIDTQPAWYYKDTDALVEALGADRLSTFIGLQVWLRHGLPVALNTDHMFGLDPNRALNPFNPFLTMYVAVTRKTEGGQVIGRAQAVTPEQALRMMTIDAARFSFDEARKGSIEVGKLGDLVVLSEDLLTCPHDRIREITPTLTVLGGQVVYEHGHGSHTTAG